MAKLRRQGLALQRTRQEVLLILLWFMCPHQQHVQSSTPQNLALSWWLGCTCIASYFITLFYFLEV